MAAPRSKNVNKRIAIVILLHFEIVTLISISESKLTYSDYVFTPTHIDDIVSDVCFIGVNSAPGIHDTGSRGLLEKIVVAFGEEESVYAGYVDLSQEFTWPSGKVAEILQHDPKNPILVVVFETVTHDRTCLSTGSAVKKHATPHIYQGSENIHIVTEFINSVCNTYRKWNGYLSNEGLHRQEILQNLFSVEHEGGKSMQELVSEQRGYCSKDTCNRSAQHSDPGYLSEEQAESLPFKTVDLGIHKCDKVEMPTKEVFFHNFLKLSKPVIIKNGINSWTALKKWTNEYFQVNYGERRVHIKLTPEGEFEGVDLASNFNNFESFKIPENVKKQLNYPDLVVVRPATADMKLSEFIEIMNAVSNGTKQGFSAYLEYSSIADIMPELEQDIHEMPFFEGMLKLEHLNIWLSDGNTLGKLHFDPFDNFLCQVSGRKQVILFEPHDNSRLYEAHIPEAMLSYDAHSRQFKRSSLVDSTSMVMSPVDITKPDLQRFPLFGKTHPLNCTIDEGDVLFMPAFWWHEVQSYPNKQQRRNLAVNFWYEPFLTKEFPCPECKLDVNAKYRHLL